MGANSIVYPLIFMFFALANLYMIVFSVDFNVDLDLLLLFTSMTSSYAWSYYWLYKDYESASSLANRAVKNAGEWREEYYSLIKKVVELNKKGK